MTLLASSSVGRQIRPFLPAATLRDWKPYPFLPYPPRCALQPACALFCALEHAVAADGARMVMWCCCGGAGLSFVQIEKLKASMPCCYTIVHE